MLPPRLFALALAAFVAPAAPVLAQAADPAAQGAAATAPDAAADAQAASADLPAICTDRPTKSNAACTVDAGHFQYESDVFNGSFLRLGGVTTDTYLVTNPTLKYGLSKTVDIEANIAPYEVVRTHDKFGGGDTLGGVGDLYLRLKWNAYTSADGKLSFALLPYIKAPTARLGVGDGAVEGGMILPVNYKLTDKITLTTAPEVDAFKDSVGDGRHLNTAQLINVGYSLPHNVTIYGELWGDWNYDPVRTVRQYSADTAVAWGLTKYLQVDAGLNFGLNRYTPGVQAYFGVSQKF
ncbi:MAG: transporter [Caulobacteraceae bacterium]|nr:transporter [Caulobacter sp.]